MCGAMWHCHEPQPTRRQHDLSVQQVDLAGKRVELLREVFPGLRRLAANIGNPSSMVEMGDAWTAARALGLEATKPEIGRVEDIAPAFEVLKGAGEALYVVSHPLLNTNRIRINTLALSARIPTMHGFREYVEVGGLMSYGPNLPDLVQAPVKFELVVNPRAARVIGLTVPPTLIARADEVIE
jgi:putative ABC transport system substrate-binding protein